MPPGEHASVNVSPSLPLSDVAFASQVVGFPAEAGRDEAVFALFAGALMLPPPLVPAALFSFFGFEQAALPRTIAADTSARQQPMIRRFAVNWYDGVTVTFLSFCQVNCWKVCAVSIARSRGQL